MNQNEDAAPSNPSTRRNRHVPLPASPEWAAFNTLLTEPTTPLSTLVAHIPPEDIPGENISKSMLMSMLARPTDPASLIDIIPFLALRVSLSHGDQAAPLVAALLRELAYHNMLAVVPEVLSIFLIAMERWVVDLVNHRRKDEHQAFVLSLNRAYGSIFAALGKFHRESVMPDMHRPDLPPAVHDQLHRVVEHLINMFGRLPSSSNPAAQPKIDMARLDRLFGPLYLTPRLRNTLVKYCEERHIALTSWMWWRCYLVAASEGNRQLAEEYARQLKRSRVEESKQRPGDIARIERLRHDALRKRGKIGASDQLKGVASKGDTASPGISATEKYYWTPKELQQLEQVILARTSQDISDVVGSLESHLLEDLDSGDLAAKNPFQGHAWSTLLTRLKDDLTIPSQTLMDLYGRFSDELKKRHVVTPIMAGLLKRGRADQAWEVWRDLVELERRSDPDKRGRHVDRSALAMGATVCQAVSDINAAITLVDLWAKRPWHTSVMSTDLAHSISLDAQNVNVLLGMCKVAGRPSVAYRLWAAALPRWGVYLDAISLTLLLDTARFAHHADETESANIGDRLRQIADELRRRQSEPEAMTNAREDYEAYDAAGFARGATTVLLDPPGYTWRRENRQAPWEKARSLFRRVLFSNYPWLKDVTSPLDFENGPYAARAGFGIVQGFRDFLHHRSANHSNSKVHHTKADESTDVRPPEPYFPRIPLRNSHFTHIVPSATTFQSYIGMLGYFNLAHEIPLALAWMKELGIRPKWNTMSMALTYVGEVEGPRRRLSGWDKDGSARLVRDEEVLRRWLCEWLEGDGGASGSDSERGAPDDSEKEAEGEEARDEHEEQVGQGESSSRDGRRGRGVVPTEEDVAAYRRHVSEKRGYLTA